MDNQEHHFMRNAYVGKYFGGNHDAAMESAILDTDWNHGSFENGSPCDNTFVSHPDALQPLGSPYIDAHEMYDVDWSFLMTFDHPTAPNL